MGYAYGYCCAPKVKRCKMLLISVTTTWQARIHALLQFLKIEIEKNSISGVTPIT
jgi:hypothetical protein